MSDKLIFRQPSIGVSAALRAAEPKRRFTLTVNNYCRALLCTRIQEAFRGKLATRTIKKVKPDYSWAPEIIYTTYTAQGNLTFEGNPVPAKLSIVTSALRKHTKRKGRTWGWEPNYVVEKGTIPIQRVRDFYYLADLLCGTFGVLLGRPRPRGARGFTRPQLRTVPKRLTYTGVDTTAVLHPGLLSLYLGQLRLAAFLAAAGQANELRKVIPDRELQSTLRRGDRKDCVRLLRRAGPWILRKEEGLWAFHSRNPERFRRLLSFLSAGHTAEDLFGSDVPANWSVSVKNDYLGGQDFHNRGFQDFMRSSGDKKIGARKKK